MKIYRLAVATLLFLFLLVSIYYVHVRFLPVNVVFYSALVDALLATAITAAAVVVLAYFSALTAFEKFLLIVIWLLMGYAIAISVPTVIDRSLSFYILEKLDQRGGGIRQDRIPEVFTREYMHEHRLVDVRLTEQLESGTIVIGDGCVQLTSEGRWVAAFSRYFRKNWLPRKRLLMGEYSADLTDPFRAGDRIVPDYLCTSD